ncbi:hypothetical protein [Bradyrhizobium australafricanum]|uniref:hypothetical protein n=2 Tax=Bradyrhizobium TaxID=374 RepID=UPI001CE3A115|nr:hypothetical protein [Bradyrhizobium australafricanum]MCA6099511.1 hypothetical protein [Bradyrhizobium australafricanum]
MGLFILRDALRAPQDDGEALGWMSLAAAKKLRNRRNNFQLCRLATFGAAKDRRVASSLMLPTGSCCGPMIAIPYSFAAGLHRILICRRPCRSQMTSVPFRHPLIAE